MAQPRLRLVAPGTEKRTVTPHRPKNSDLRTREYLTQQEIEALICEYRQDIDSGFLVEGPEKLRRIARHFQARANQVLPTSPRCNAPWVSAVIEADGTVRPCFFHNPVGNIHDRSLLDILNGEDARSFRETLDIATNPTCRNCVCSLFLPMAEGA